MRLQETNDNGLFVDEDRSSLIVYCDESTAHICGWFLFIEFCQLYIGVLSVKLGKNIIIISIYINASKHNKYWIFSGIHTHLI
jgi:hypothetical protein